MAAGLALVLCSPVLALAALAIVWESGFPVFFRQERVGQNGRIFQILKLRTMRTNQQGSLITASGDRRVTRVGALLRKYKLDEWPQLWNIVMGQMQFIGPRPELRPLVTPHDPLWREVLPLKPGLTDLATLVYRNEEEILAGRRDPQAAYRHEILPRKLALSAAYNQKRNAGTNLKLLALTVRYSLFPGGFEADTIRRIFLESE
jgi:lipopolysaccharide/colanic/teichoic acid biosynthesis glycosyltransferase